MLRYLRLYRHLVAFSFSRAMEFRVDFFFKIFMDLMFYVVNVLFFRLIYLQTPVLAGWDQRQVMLFVAGYLLIDAVYMTVFAGNLWMLPLFVNRGDLDYYLVRPVSSLFFLSLREFAANSFVNLLMAIGILAWAIHQLPGEVSAAQVALYCGLILNGVFLYYLVRIVWIVPVFWMHSARGLDGFIQNFIRFVERPDRLFTGWFRRVLLTVAPFGLMASLPARIFFGEGSLRNFALLGAVTAGFLVLALFAWHRGVRAYSSASS